MSAVIMGCGCRSMTTHQNEHNGLPAGHPSCLTHDRCDVAATPPDLTGRRARCDYFGRGGFRNHGLIYGGGECTRKECRCEVPSSFELPFFAYLGEGSQHHRAKKGPQPFDNFFCGCAGWD